MKVIVTILRIPFYKHSADCKSNGFDEPAFENWLFSAEICRYQDRTALSAVLAFTAGHADYSAKSTCTEGAVSPTTTTAPFASA